MGLEIIYQWEYPYVSPLAFVCTFYTPLSTLSLYFWEMFGAVGVEDQHLSLSTMAQKCMALLLKFVVEM